MRVGDGVARHALTFTVKPGSESKVAELLAGYESPKAQVDDTTRLRRTSLFMHGNRVVRAVEVEGDLLAALRHVARQPEVRAVEEAINPYLEQDRDLTDPESARLFFTRAALPAVHHVTAGGQSPRGCGGTRCTTRPSAAAAWTWPGSSPTRTRPRRTTRTARCTRAPCSSGTTSWCVSSTSPATSTWTRPPRWASRARAGRRSSGLLDGAAIGVEGDLDSERNLNRLLSHADMLPVTDRSAAAS